MSDLRYSSRPGGPGRVQHAFDHAVDPQIWSGWPPASEQPTPAVRPCVRLSDLREEELETPATAGGGYDLGPRPR